jgi:hypothetical protein
MPTVMLGLSLWSALTDATNAVQSAEVDRLVVQLGASKFADREAATKRLEAMGQPAWIAIARAAEKTRDPEIRRRLEGIRGRDGRSVLELATAQRRSRAFIKGRVTYDGEPPSRPDLKPLVERSADRIHCLKGDTRDPLWIVSPQRGVANVVVWLRPSNATHFDVPADLRSRSDVVLIGQPLATFEPHVVAINPSTWDAETKRQRPTGQLFKALNNSPINHNVHCGGNSLLNPTKNVIIPPNLDVAFSAKPCRDRDSGREELLSIGCDMHRWMSAKVAVFDHPYYAVTDANGNFEIANVSTDMDVMIAVWHESFGTLRQARLEGIRLKPGENRKDLKIK